MGVKVKMLTTSATEDRILMRGCTYNLSKEEATLLVESSHGPGKQRHAELDPDAKKVTKVTRPDPEDVPEQEEDWEGDTE